MIATARRAERHRLLGEPARLQILDAVSAAPRLIADLTAATGLHRNTVRAHLARLIEAGLVATEVRPPSGPGRPAVRYRLRDRLGLPGAEQALLIQSLLRLVSTAYEGGASSRAEEEGHAVGTEFAVTLAERDAEHAVAALVGLLRDLAFAPELSTAGGMSRIALHSCPFAVSPDDPRGAIICAFHLGLIRGVIETAGPPGRHVVRLRPHAAPDLCETEIAFAS